jgi:CubicO group peptidase (beta-lactamase class C family)
VERLNGGIRLGEYMEKHIWGPLDMTSTTFNMESKPGLKAHKVDMTLRVPTGQLIHLPTPVYPSPAQDDCGGVGGYSTAPDYMKLLTSLLRDDGKLLKSSTIEEMLRPQLPNPKYLEQVLQIPELHSVLASNFPKGLKVNHGLGGMLNMEPLPTGRSAGAMQWGGMPNLFWVSKVMLKFHYTPTTYANSGSIARAGCVGHTSHNSCLQETPRP